MVDRNDKPKDEFQRVELIVGSGRRRVWTLEQKGRIVAETLMPGAVISEIARRHGLRPQQVFGWRHEAKKGLLALPGDGPLPFVPIVVADASSAAAKPAVECTTVEVVEIEILGARVRARPGMDPGHLIAVLRAIRVSAA